MPKLTLFQTGYCTHSEAMVIKGGQHRSLRFYATCALIEHPQWGLGLFDTGYTQRFHTATQHYPQRLYANLTPVVHQEEEALVYQLKRHGVSAKDIRWVLLSHFHADHIGGCRDFPNARFYVHSAAYLPLRHKRGFSALRKGFLPSLLPDSFDTCWQAIETLPKKPLPPHLYPFTEGYALSADESLMAIELPGHCPGQLGLYVQEAASETFLIADACWLSQSYQEQRPPHPVALALLGDASLYHHTLAQLHTLHKHNPDLRLLPTHCPETMALCQPLI
jgi:glyoxylase-like metal-dependent hydrolase (beta-lactamase superfamily II)